MIYLYAFVILLSCICDKLRDTRANNQNWRTQYKKPSWIPTFLWRKFQDRWHVAKQIGFLLPQACLLYVCYNTIGLYSLALIPAGLVAWRYVIPDPKHWHK